VPSIVWSVKRCVPDHERRLDPERALDLPAAASSLAQVSLSAVRLMQVTLEALMVRPEQPL
jgi:hypothetical protein